MRNETLECLRQLEPTNAQRLYFGILYTILTTAGMILNILLIRIILLQRLKTRGNVVYQLTISLNVSSIIYLVCNYPIMLVCTYTECSFYSDILMIAVASLNTLGFYASFSTITYIAIERISMFLWKRMHDLIDKHVIVYIAIPWAVALFVTAATTGIGCYKR